MKLTYTEGNIPTVSIYVLIVDAKGRSYGVNGYPIVFWALRKRTR